MKDDPFEESLEGSEERFVSANAEARQERWEERVVKKLVQAHVGASDAATVLREMKEEVRETTGEPRLTFDVFITTYPAFPVWLVSRPVPYAHKHIEPAELQAKREHWFRRLFQEARDRVPDGWDDRPHGLVFEMLNVNSQFNVLHNHDSPLPKNVDGVRYSFPERKGKSMMHLDPIDLFLKSIGWLKSDE